MRIDSSRVVGILFPPSRVTRSLNGGPPRKQRFCRGPAKFERMPGQELNFPFACTHSFLRLWHQTIFTAVVVFVYLSIRLWSIRIRKWVNFTDDFPLRKESTCVCVCVLQQTRYPSITSPVLFSEWVTLSTFPSLIFYKSILVLHVHYLPSSISYCSISGFLPMIETHSGQIGESDPNWCDEFE